MTIDNHEIYPNTPLKLAAFEIRYAPIPKLESDLWEAIYDQLRETLPILGPKPKREFNISSTGMREQRSGHRLMNRSRTTSATLYDGVTTLETSEYTRFEEWTDLIRELLSALDDVAQIPSVQRLGLRYIDEVSVKNGDQSESIKWSDYIADNLLTPTTSIEHDVVNYLASMEMRVDEHHLINFQFGSLSDPVVDPNGPLKIKQTPENEFFLLDIDSYWIAPDSEYPSFNLSETLTTVERLHEPVRELFEKSITDKLRDLMRGDVANG